MNTLVRKLRNLPEGTQHFLLITAVMMAAIIQIIDTTIAEFGKSADANTRALIRRNARAIITEAAGDFDKLEDIAAKLYKAPLTKKQAERAATKARKQAAAATTNPGDNAPPVAQADALRGRLRL